MALATHTASD